jgi:cell division protein ZapA
MNKGQVTVTINGIDYPMACVPGEEQKVIALGARIDEIARRVSADSGPITEARILVMTALILTDKMSEFEEKLMKDDGAVPASGGESLDDADRMASIIDSLTTRLEKLASGRASS